MMKDNKGIVWPVVIIAAVLILIVGFFLLRHRNRGSLPLPNPTQSTAPGASPVGKSGSGNLPLAQLKSVTTLIDQNGGRVDWSQTNNLIAYSIFSQPNSYGAEIYTMNPDGSNKICLTCNASQIPHLSNDQPAWHPNGNYILFQSVDPGLPKPAGMADSQYQHLTQGGFGYDNNLWIVTKDGKNFYQLTHLQSGEGSLHPHFSADGSKLLWSAHVAGGGQGGHWVLRVADFIDNGNPHLGATHDYAPLGGNVFYESHDFTPDGGSILFSTNTNPDHSTSSCSSCMLTIWKMNLASGQVTALTSSSNVWNEHAHISADGQKIDWISSQGYNFSPNENWAASLKTDLWLMNADGSGKQQITNLNSSGKVILADSSWDKAGDKIVVSENAGGSNKIILVQFTSPQ